jgi:glucokinase
MTERLPQALGIDVGGTKINAVRIDADGLVHAREILATPADDTDATLEALVGALRAVHDERVVAVGVGAAGLVEALTGILRYAPNLAWRDVPLAKVVESALDLPVVVDNDCSAAAYGEYRLGAARGHRHVLYVGVGTGIGGGIVVDGRIDRGAHGFAGEIGHMIVERDGLRCGCGNDGCWETVASGSALAHQGRAAALLDPSLAARAGGDPEAVTGELVVQAAREGDAVAAAIVARVGRRLGEGIAGLVNIFDPEIVVVGGGVARAADVLLPPARAAAADTVEGGPYRPDVPIVPAALGPDAAAIAAGVMALDEHV